MRMSIISQASKEIVVTSNILAVTQCVLPLRQHATPHNEQALYDRVLSYTPTTVGKHKHHEIGASESIYLTLVR